MIGAKFGKRKGHITSTTPLLGVVCHRRLKFDTVYMRANFVDSSFSLSGYMVGAHQNLNGSRDLTTPLSGIVFHPLPSTYNDQPMYQI